MRLLIDTNILIWWLTDDVRLGPQARTFIADVEGETLVSIASYWEMSIKWGLGKMTTSGSSAMQVAHDAGFRTLNISAAHLALLENLEPIEGHNDPFDRIILVHAISEHALLMTSDRQMRGYDVRSYDKRLDR